MSTTAPKEVWDEAMRKAGYASMQELADAIGVTEKSLKRWITGISHPRHRKDVNALADLLYIDAEVLFPGWLPMHKRGMTDQELTPMYAAMLRAGYSTIKDFAIASGKKEESIAVWMHGNAPRYDETVYKLCGLLNVAPTDIWPNWQPSTNTFMQKIFDAGYPTVTAFAQKIGLDHVTVDNWIHAGAIPRGDDTVLMVAGLLNADPNELWPDWIPRPNKKKKASTYIRSYAPRADHGVTPLFTEPEITYNGMDHIRRKADVQIGKRLRVTCHYKDHTAHRVGTVVQRTDCFFRVQYDHGWSECFHYQARLDASESKHFHDA